MGNDRKWRAKERKRVEINDDPARLRGTFPRVSEGGPAGGKSSALGEGSGLQRVGWIPAQGPCDQVLSRWPPPVNPAGWCRVGTMGPLQISIKGYFISHLLKYLQERPNTPFEKFFCIVKCVNDSNNHKNECIGVMLEM